MHAAILATPIIMATWHLGVFTTMHTPFLHPTQTARFGSHLDRLSGGRWGWGWNIVNGCRDYEASLFRTPLWSAQEMLRLKPVFDLLAEAGVWLPPERRNHS